jgi:hypothetical protein
MHRSEPHLYSITSMAQASMGATLLRYQCPRPVRVPPKWVVRDMFDLPMHSWWRRTKTGATFPRALANRPLVSRPRGRLNGARIHTLEFSKISEDPR